MPSIVNSYSGASGGGGAYRSLILASGPLAYWRLNDPDTLATETDETGGGRDLTWSPTSAHVYSSSHPDPITDGGSAYLASESWATTAENLMTPSLSAFSFSCWLLTPPDMRTSLWGGVGYVTSGVENSPTWPARRLRTVHGMLPVSSNADRWDFSLGAWTAAGSNPDRVSFYEVYAMPWGGGLAGTFPPWAPGTWHHFAYTASSTGLLSAYVDGIVNASIQLSSGYDWGGHRFQLSYGLLHKGWNGNWSEVATWGRALTASEIAQQWALGSGA